jgi:hypothetical protein
MTESYVYVTGLWSSQVEIKVDIVLLWSFMAIYEGNTHLFEKFWLQQPPINMLHYSSFQTGLYNGWSLIFVIQIITLIYYLMCLLNWKGSRVIRENHPIWLLILPLATILAALFQGYIQHEIIYHQYSQAYTGTPTIGFWISLLSVGIALIATLKASEQSPFKNIPRSLKKVRKRTWLAVCILSIMIFFMVQEIECQGGITKVMDVEDQKDFQEIQANPELWKSHLNKIVLIASLFRARVVDNYAGWASCHVEAPVASYQILVAVLNSMGYVAGEPIFFHLN